MHQLVLLRHGQSEWNLANRFTGWKDVDLTEEGCQQAKEAGRLLREAGFEFDIAFTSVLKRAIRTLWLALDELDQMWIDVERSWLLNERHYGDLQGKNKAETAAKYGDEQVLIWRRSFSTPPPPLGADDERHPKHDRRYAGLAPDQLPTGEALCHTVDRVLPYWNAEIVPQIRAGKQVIIVAHGNSLRALVQELDGLSEEEILKLNIPTGVPLVYELDEELRAVGSRYLGDQSKVEAAIAEVAGQGKSA